MNLGSLLVAAVLAAQGEAAGSDTPLRPLVAQPTGGPAVVLYATPNVPLVALRLAVPAEEPPGLRGMARVLQHLARSRMREAAAERGAEAEVVRTATHAVYQITGPAAAFDELAAILRRAVAFPNTTARELSSARALAEAEALVEQEMPEPLVRHRLRALLAPEPAAAGAAARGLALEWLHVFWAARFRPRDMQAVVVGDVPLEVAASAFQHWAAPADLGQFEPPAAAPPAKAEPQVLFPWLGLGYPADDIEPATLAVAARLVRLQLARAGLRAATSEAWWAPPRRALVVLGAARQPSLPPPAPPRGRGAPAPPVRHTADEERRVVAQRLRTALAEAAALLTPEAVAEARAGVRQELLLAARTPLGLADLAGELLERTGDPTSAAAFLAALERTDAGAVHAAFLTLLARGPVLTEAQP